MDFFVCVFIPLHFLLLLFSIWGAEKRTRHWHREPASRPREPLCPGGHCFQKPTAALYAHSTASLKPTMRSPHKNSCTFIKSRALCALSAALLKPTMHLPHKNCCTFIRSRALYAHSTAFLKQVCARTQATHRGTMPQWTRHLIHCAVRSS